MMGVEDDDLESYWTLFRRPPAIHVASGKVSNLREGLELAALKAEQALHAELDVRPGKLTLTPIPDIVSLCIQTLLIHWYEGLQNHGPGSLLELVLADQRLPSKELKDFVRALPDSLLRRILESEALDRASGIHGLVTVEHHFRSGLGREYDLRRGCDDVISVILHPTSTQEAVVFRLDENFSLGE